MTNSYKTFAHEHGGRVALLFLLFLLAIYSFITTGYSAFALICILPFLIVALYCAFRWKMLVFWGLIFINYNIHFFAKNGWIINT